MHAFILHTADCAEIAERVEVSHPALLPPAESGWQWTEVPAPVADWTVQLDGGGAVEVVAFDQPTEVALMLAKAAERAAINARRDAVIFGGCTTPKGRVDTDAESQIKITGAVQMALLAIQAGETGWSLAWTMQDNATVTHDASEMIAMGQAVGAFVSAAHANALTMKAAVEDAATLAAVAAIDIDAGWPG